MSTRKHEFNIPIRTTPDELWKALTEPEQIQAWFAPSIRVVPGEGGSIWMSWGEGMEGETKIEEWEPGKHLRTGAPMPVDYRIESEGETTILRLVQDGFSADAAFDGEYESTYGGWTTFLNMLRHRLERHPAEQSKNIWIMRQIPAPPAEVWKRIAASGELDKGIAVPGHPAGYGGFELPDLNGSYLAVFCEGKSKTMLTIACILYGPAMAQEGAVRARWDDILNSGLAGVAAG